jgi:hypothetical protein
MSNQSYIPKIKTGVCKCGHMWDDHHLGVVMNSDALKVHKEHGAPPYVPQECEMYGWNEVGGKMYDPDTERWVDHCHQYEEDTNAEDQLTWAERAS